MLQELRSLWDSLPHKAAFGLVVAAWFALFHFLGNSTLGYIQTDSMFGWLQAVYEGGAQQGRDDELGLMIPWLVGAIIVVRRSELTAIAKEPWTPALALVPMGLLLHLSGYVVQQTRLGVVGFLVGLFGIMGMYWGRAWMRGFAFPTIVFQKASATAQGFRFDVAPACSGIRSATVVLLLTVTFAFLNFRTPWRRIFLILLSPAFAVLANVIRLIVVFAVAEAAGQAAGEAVETKFGFATFLIALGCVFLVARWLQEPDSVNVSSGTTAAEVASSGPTTS